MTHEETNNNDKMTSHPGIQKNIHQQHQQWRIGFLKYFNYYFPKLNISKSPVLNRYSNYASQNKTTDDLIESILDPRVVEAIAKALAPFVRKTVGDVLSTKLEGLISDLPRLKDENTPLRARILDQDLRIDELEAYSRSDNLIVRGLPENSMAERASVSGGADKVLHLAITESVESKFIAFCKDSLNVFVQPSDISITHRLKADPKDKVRSTLVRFTTCKARKEVFGAKRLLKSSAGGIFISRFYQLYIFLPE